MKMYMEKIKKYLKNTETKTFILACIMFAIPSIIYYTKNKTIYRFDKWFKFRLNDTNRLDQTIIYIIILVVLTVLFYIIIKNREKIFKKTKKMFIFIAIVSIIFIAVIPFTCSDVFYYMGVGRIDSKYSQNPYYTTIKEFVEQDGNSKYLKEDTVLAQGYINDWSNSTVVYGPIWTLICKTVSALSFGNIDIGLLIFKILNLIVHILNCYLIYKITNKKIFVLLYGINPFVLIEGIACVHNDIFVICFTLLSLYFLIKKKKILLSVVFLALATAIKYFTILLLPILIIYHFRKEKPSKRFLRCIQYGAIFILTLGICYLMYVRDFQVLSGLFIQQQKFAKNFYIIILEYLKNPSDFASIVNRTLLYGFIIIYFFYCIILLNKKNIKFRIEMKNINYFFIAFLFLLITNFQPWYIMWLFPCIMWQKAKMIKLIVQISLVSQFANSVFLTYGEGWKNGTPFTFFMLLGIMICIIMNNELKTKKLIKK